MQDYRLLRKLQGGQEEALTDIFHLYNRSLLYFALQYVKTREVAEEIVSDVFVKVWRLREDFYEIEKLKAFLYISTKNACLNHLKTSYIKQKKINIDECGEFLSDDSDTYMKIIKAELVKSIFEEVSKLPLRQQEVFRLSYLDDLSTEEISEKLKISHTSVYTNRSRAIKTLRNSLRIIDSAYAIIIFNELFS